MSWHFSRALEEEYSAANCLGGEQSAPWNSIPFARDDSCSAKMKDTWHHSPFGMMFVPLLENHGAALLTWYLEVSPVKISARRAQAQDLTANEAGSGRIWRGSLAKYDPVTHTWKTRQFSLLGGSTEFSETWPRWGLMRDGELYLLPMSERTICERESGLLPTPTVCGNYNRKGASPTSGDGLITALRKMWPTMLARDSRTVRGGRDR